MSMTTACTRLTLPTMPWRDRRGRLSALRIGTLGLLVAPVLMLIVRAAMGRLGAEPLAEAINSTGTDGARILVLSLAITPLRRLYDAPGLVDVRRMIGVAAFLYILAHLTLYAVQQDDLAKVASEIARRVYLTIGFATLVGLGALAATSTDGMIRRLGAPAWRRLHRVVYALVVLGLLHVWLQVRLADYYEALVLSGLVVWLFMLRWLTGRGPIGAGRALALALAATAATAGGEAVYLWGRLGADPLDVMSAQFTSAAGVRPAAVVLALTVPIALLALGRSRRRRACAPARKA